MVTDAPDGKVVDHINHNGLDNRRANLRVVSQISNTWNSRQGRRFGSSQYKGVSWAKRRSKWVATISTNGKKRFLGHFDDEIQAAKAYDKAAKKYRGHYAYLNFPQKKEKGLRGFIKRRLSQIFSCF
jgi:hypothetical protein